MILNTKSNWYLGKKGDKLRCLHILHAKWQSRSHYT